jgi:hypothetical protein
MPAMETRPSFVSGASALTRYAPAVSFSNAKLPSAIARAPCVTGPTAVTVMFCALLPSLNDTRPVIFDVASLKLRMASAPLPCVTVDVVLCSSTSAPRTVARVNEILARANAGR